LPQRKGRQKKRKRSKRSQSPKKSGIGAPVIIALIIGALVIAGIAYLISQNTVTTSPAPATPPATPAAEFTPPAPVSVDADGTATMASGLKYKDIVEGTGESPKPGKLVTVHYTGTFPDGEKFDSSVDKGPPYKFVIGSGRVIKGWDEGIMTMKVGGKRKLIVPPDLAYGANGRDGIPPNATLLFEVELLGVN